MIDMMPSFIPDAERLVAIFSSAAAPTFFLGAVAAFASLMTVRMREAIDRIRELNAISPEDLDRAHLKDDLDRLMRRAGLLRQGILSSLVAGVFATVLLAVLFATEFAGLRYAYGAGILFMFATFSLGFGLFRFAQEVAISLDKADHY